jgi:hypothetical protein
MSPDPSKPGACLGLILSTAHLKNGVGGVDRITAADGDDPREPVRHRLFMQAESLADSWEELRSQGFEEAEAAGRRLKQELAGPADAVLDLADDRGFPAQGVVAD